MVFKTNTGDKFDQVVFDALPKGADGKITKEQFMTLAGAGTTDANLPGATPDAPAPVDGATTVTPVIECPMTELPTVVDAARLAGLTPLILDRSANHLLDTFHNYKADGMLDAKMWTLKLAKKEIPQEDALEGLRHKLSYSMARGQDLVISMQSACPSFSTTLNSETFPLEVFKESGKSLINDASASTIITDAHAKELGQGFKICQPDFKVQVTSHFGVDDLDDFLFGEGFGLEKVPRAWFQVINIKHGEGTELLD
ncbi:hypothetical protein TL16_g02092 [Triparma laevis f. inornata]|uniref:Uncharacterized protein n=1 Tax=Triparma laevis f. inornata TaxID=1714386 RepID=A0A9W6ZNH8_9STRA|nr:hypothetical protein TL16_g02092 [Triparma laevis f. inornata]